MSVYMVVESKVKDSEKYSQYLPQLASIVSKYHCRDLVRSGKIAPLLGCEWTPEIMIILEFPSKADVEQWLSSTEYQSIAQLREAVAEIRAVLQEGYKQEE